MITCRRWVVGLTAIFALATAGLGATSYLLVQGPFGSGGATQTFKWQVNYSNGQLVTGQDLLKAVFGTPVSTGTYDDAFFGTYPYLTSTNGSLAAGYISFSEGPFPESFTINGTKVAQDTDYDPFWYYQVSKGTDTSSTVYPSGLWTEAQAGAVSRFLTDGSFDSWTFGPFGVSVAGSDGSTGTSLVNDPVASSFSGATVINLAAAPEPGRMMLLATGLLVAGLRRRRVSRAVSGSGL